MNNKPQYFGYVKESMEHFIPELLKQKSGKKIVINYINEIKNSKEIKNLYNFYENINELNENIDAFKLITEWKKNITVDIQKLNEENNKFQNILLNACELLGEKASDLLPDNSQRAFYEIVESVYKEAPNITNMGKYFNKISLIKESIISRKVNQNEKANEAYDKIAQSINKAAEALLDEQKMVTEKLTKEEQFNLSKNRCLKRLNEIKSNFDADSDEISSKKMQNYIDNINNKKFNEDTVSIDVKNFKELTECFK